MSTTSTTLPANEALTNASYKRLGFVENYAGYALQTADKIYKTVRVYVPSSLTPYVKSAEEVVLAKSAPALSTAQDVGGKALHALDSRVDYVIGKTSSVLSSGKSKVANSVGSLHEENTHKYYGAMKTYFDAVISQADWIADKLSPVKNVQVARESLHSAVVKAWEITDPDKAVESVNQAWTKFAGLPAVSALLQTAEPYTHKSVSYLHSLHDWLVANPTYKTTVDTTSASLAWYLETPPAKLAKSWIYPAVAPIADPAYERLSKSSAVQKTVDYWRPVDPAAAA